MCKYSLMERAQGGQRASRNYGAPTSTSSCLFCMLHACFMCHNDASRRLGDIRVREQHRWGDKQEWSAISYLDALHA